MNKLHAVLIVLSLAFAARAHAQVISIAEARSLPVGSSGQFAQYEALPRHRGDIHLAIP